MGLMQGGEMEMPYLHKCPWDGNMVHSFLETDNKHEYSCPRGTRARARARLGLGLGLGLGMG